MDHDQPEFRAERERMVAQQIERRAVRDPRVLEAIRRVPRHRFVLPEDRALAYQDRPLSIGHGQTISQPYMVALMTAALQPAPDKRMLDVGTGSGYQSAVLAECGCRVWSLERVPELSARAQAVLAELGYGDRCQLRVADGSLGWPDQAPFDGVVVGAGAPELPQALCQQLADGGRLVAPVGPRHLQELLVVERRGDDLHRRRLTDCTFVPLLGEQGWAQ